MTLHAHKHTKKLLGVGTLLLATATYVASTASSDATADNQKPIQTNSDKNTAYGKSALEKLTKGTGNTAVGSEALQANTQAIENTAVGFHALRSNTSGGRSVAVGYQALAASTGPVDRPDNASSNTAVGWKALQSNTTGIQNTAIGESALTKNTTGFHNTAIGEDVLYNNNNGGGNTAMGESALYDNLDGSNNVSIGRYSMNHATGNRNIALGVQAGCAITNGDNNIFIGSLGKSGDTNVIRIGGDGSAHHRCPHDVSLPIQTETYIAGIAGTQMVSGQQVYIDANGKLGVRSTSADLIKQKKALQPTEAFLKLKPVSFNYSDDNKAIQYGLIAEDTAQSIPEIVVFNEDKPVAINQQALTILLLTQMQEDHKKLNRLIGSVNKMKAENEQLRRQISMLRNKQ